MLASSGSRASCRGVLISLKERRLKQLQATSRKRLYPRSQDEPDKQWLLHRVRTRIKGRQEDQEDQKDEEDQDRCRQSRSSRVRVDGRDIPLQLAATS